MAAMDHLGWGVRARSVLLAVVAAACSPAPVPRPAPTTVTVEAEPEAAASGPTECEVVAAVVGPNDEPVIERRKAGDCLGAYEALGVGSGAVVWVTRVGGLGNDSQLTEAWDVPDVPGSAPCSVAIGIESGRATGHAEGTPFEETKERAREDACRQLGLSASACREQTSTRSTRLELRIIDGEQHSEATVEVVVTETAKGEGAGETKLDACRAAIRSACRTGKCRGARISVQRIDGVPLGMPSSWPRPKGPFGLPQSAPP